MPCRVSGGGSSAPTIRRISSARSSWTKIGRADDAAGAHNHGAVTAIIEIVELVADQDRRRAAAFQEANEAQQPVAFVRRQHRRRFIEDEKPRVVKQRPDQFDLLTAADRQRRDAGVERNVRAKVFRYARKLGAQLLEAQNAVTQFRAAENQVLLDRQILNEVEVLMDERDAGLLRVGGRVQRDRSSRRSRFRRNPAPARPPSILTRVDLPAPFSPTMPTISPGKIENETSSLARS